MKLRKVLIGIFIVLVTVGWFVGDYFTNFAFRRGNAKDPLALPDASKGIITANLAPPQKPAFNNEEWSLVIDNEKRVATAFYTTIPTDKWIVMVHGYCRDQRYVWDYAERYLKLGYNVLTPDLNASGKSEGKYLTMGVKESQDLEGWVKQLLGRKSQAKIALHGVSMGAATVMLTAQKPLPKQVYAVIEDCGYTSAYDMFSLKLKEMFGLPSFPVLNFTDVVNYVKTGVYVSDAAPIKKIKTCALPMLFIHGDNDELVPLSMQRELYKNCGSGAKEEYIVHDADHARSMVKDPDKYFSIAVAFLKKHEN